MAVVPNSNLSGLPEITATDLKSNDPSRINRVFRLFATQIQKIQTTTPTPSGVTSTTIIQEVTGGGGGGGGSSSGGGVETIAPTIQGTHIQRLSTYLPATETLGTFYYETDRTVFYLNFSTPAATQVWQYLTGVMHGLYAAKPTDLGTYDAGFLYYATDLDLTYRWSGSAWSIYNNIEPVLQDTHANRLADYPSVNYSANTLFFESDRGVFYIVQTATGTVNTSGTSITWASGDYFINSGTGFTAAQWPAGTQITIGTTSYPIASVSSKTALTLSTSAGTHSGLTYTVVSGLWVYATGEYSAAYSSMPTDLGNNDTRFIFVDNATYYRSWTWGGAAWTYTIGQPPYLAVQMSMSNSADPGWHAADGTSGVTVTKTDGTTTTVNLPNPSGYFIEGGTYTGSGVAAVKTTINAVTPTGTINTSGLTFTGSSSGSETVQSGTGATAAPPFTASGTIGGTATFSGTPFTATVNAEGTPPAFVFAFYVKL